MLQCNEVLFEIDSKHTLKIILNERTCSKEQNRKSAFHTFTTVNFFDEPKISCGRLQLYYLQLCIKFYNDGHLGGVTSCRGLHMSLDSVKGVWGDERVMRCGD